VQNPSTTVRRTWIRPSASACCRRTTVLGMLEQPGQHGLVFPSGKCLKNSGELV